MHITTRKYKVGEAIVPEGCTAISYYMRLDVARDSDLIISATRSPHYTVTYDQVCDLENPPRMIIDLSVPRDIDPAIAKIPGVRCVNIDEIGWDDSDDMDLTRVYEVFDDHLNRFDEWLAYKLGNANAAIS